MLRYLNVRFGGRKPSRGHEIIGRAAGADNGLIFAAVVLAQLSIITASDSSPTERFLRVL